MFSLSCAAQILKHKYKCFLHNSRGEYGYCEILDARNRRTESSTAPLL
jgi:hypothetical protein